MFKWLAARRGEMYKEVLANRLRARGICLKHGIQKQLDRSIGSPDHLGRIHGEYVCSECQREWQDEAEGRKINYDRETMEMWEEYKKLC